MARDPVWPGPQNCPVKHCFLGLSEVTEEGAEESSTTVIKRLQQYSGPEESLHINIR